MLDRYRISSIRCHGYYFCFVVLICAATIRGQCLFPATINNGWRTELKLTYFNTCNYLNYLNLKTVEALNIEISEH